MNGILSVVTLLAAETFNSKSNVPQVLNAKIVRGYGKGGRHYFGRLKGQRNNLYQLVGNKKC